jgi:hypothetical protein
MSHQPTGASPRFGYRLGLAWARARTKPDASACRLKTQASVAIFGIARSIYPAADIEP